MGKRIAVASMMVVVAVAAIAFGPSITGLFALPLFPEEVKIGFIVAQTGKYAVGGEESLQGLLLAEKEINANSGIGGKKLRVIVEDNKSDQKEAISAFRKLVNVDGVSIIIGGQISGPSLAMAPVAEEEHVLLFTTTATTAKLDDAGEYVFKFQAGNEAHAKKSSDAMLQLGYRRVALVYANTEYCKDQANFLEKEFEEKGIEAVAEEKYETTAIDMRGQLLKIGERKPEAVYMCGYYEDQGRLLKQARELGLEKPFFAVTTIENAKFLEIAGKAAEGVIYTSSTFSCEKEGEFCKRYELEFGEKATYRSAYLYDALHLVANAIEKYGASPKVLKEKLPGSTFEGVAGKAVFDGKGNTEREFALKTIEGGKFVPYE